MRRAPVLALILATTFWLGCTASPRPVPVVAGTADLNQLAGTWSGTYDSPAVGRRGTISFQLEAGRDTAHGDVIMIPRGWNEPLGPVESPAEVAREAPLPETLDIRFVQVRDGTISGTMEPYRDPDCGCAVYTTFTGTLKDGVIEGTFTSRPSSGGPYRGTWLVKREPAKEPRPD